jgi:hypothetical protein
MVKQYEAQQPPLYYMLAAVPYRLIRNLSLPAKVLILRLVSIFFASAVIFVAYELARELLPALGFPSLIPILIACLPGLFINVARVGNECLAIPICSAVVLAMTRVVRSRSTIRSWAALGSFLTAALLTKAYALCFVPLLFIVGCLCLMRSRGDRRAVIRGFAVAVTLIVAGAGWWYLRAWVTTGTLSGEQLDVAASAGRSIPEKLRAVTDVDWRAVADSTAFSHIWIGGWSFLVVRSWMHRVFEIIAAVSFVGLVMLFVGFVRRWWHGHAVGAFGTRLGIVAAGYASMCIALAYHSLVVFVAKGLSTGLGWYLYAAVAAEVVLIAAGLISIFGCIWAGRLVAGICILAIALDLYANHVILMPWYSGATRHYPEAVRPDGLQQIFSRLAVNESAAIGPSAVAGIWAAYLCATLALGTLAVLASCAFDPQKTPKNREGQR